MNFESSKSLSASLHHLAKLDKAHFELGKDMLEAYGGALYGMDLLAIGALNRSVAHIAGFRTLIEARNLICAGALLRLQLDTTMRFFASFIVEKPHDFAVKVLAGKRIRDLQDRDGSFMTDAYLARRLGEEFEWVPRVYDRTSGYIHFSSTHLMSALTLKEGNETSFEYGAKISADDKPLPECIYIEASDAFCASTEILLRYVHGWATTKAHPELIEKWKQKHT